MEAVNIYFILFGIVYFVIWLCFFLWFNLKEKKKDEMKSNKELNESLPKKIKTLTKNQIDEIHKRGNITAEEKVKEWEDFGICAPGDAIGSASNRCEKFNNCHECLCDYAADCDEYKPLEFKYTNYFKDEDFFGTKLK